MGLLLYYIISRFADIDLHPQAVPSDAMGYIFEELLRKFSEMSNEAAGEHFTPREVVRIMVNILFTEDDDDDALGAASNDLPEAEWSST